MYGACWHYGDMHVSFSPRVLIIFVLCIGGTNKLVEVNFESAERVLCNFHHSTSSSYICRIKYGQCGKELSMSKKGYTLAELPSTVRIDLRPNLQQQDCYTITASHDTYTVFLKGSFSKFHEIFARRKFSLILPPVHAYTQFCMIFMNLI